MERRTFLAGTGAMLLGTPLTSEAQEAGKVYRIGFLSTASATTAALRVEAFRLELRELGYIEGRNVTIEYRWAEGKDERLPGLAAELVSLKVDIIVTQGTVPTVGGPEGERYDPHHHGYRG